MNVPLGLFEIHGILLRILMRKLLLSTMFAALGVIKTHRRSTAVSCHLIQRTIKTQEAFLYKWNLHMQDTA